MQPRLAAVDPPELLSLDESAALLNRLKLNLEKAFLGKSEVIDLVLTALLAEGHILIEDVPGVGKTLLAKALARSLACLFHRIQFTPDLLPSDLIGTSVFHQPSGEFRFHAGPLFAQVVLADEINRATPRTQSALLEAMSERQITLDGASHALGPPFIVLATQNPFEFEGTYPLPESQLDRFLVRVQIGHPGRAAEREILAQHRVGEPVMSLEPVLSPDEVIGLQKTVRQVRFDDRLSEYLLNILERTRTTPEVGLGASTRAGLGLYRAAQAWALLHGRAYVIPDDIKRLTIPVLAHRLLMRSSRHGNHFEAASHFLAEELSRIMVPL
jgi:MoxR-like ATPase